MTKKITRYELDAIQTAIYNAFERDCDFVDINRTGSLLGKEVRFGVSWSARGTKGTEETKAMAEYLMQAAAIAEALNSLKLEMDYDLSYDPTNHEATIELYQSFIESKMAQFAGIACMEAK